MDPAEASVTIHRHGRTPCRLSVSDTLDGIPVLPGFRRPVGEILTGSHRDARPPESARLGFAAILAG